MIYLLKLDFYDIVIIEKNTDVFNKIAQMFCRTITPKVIEETIISSSVGQYKTINMKLEISDYNESKCFYIVYEKKEYGDNDDW
jgi:Trm5-related predicted tRNA methylase